MGALRIEIETLQEQDGRWGASWRYEVSPCRGGPCGTAGYYTTEMGARVAAMALLLNDMGHGDETQAESDVDKEKA